MSTVTGAVRDYIVPRLIKAERIVVAAQSAAASPDGYVSFGLAIQTIHECRRAVAEEPTRDSAASLILLDKACKVLAMTIVSAAPSVREAMNLIEEAAVLVRPTPAGINAQ